MILEHGREYAYGYRDEESESYSKFDSDTACDKNQAYEILLIDLLFMSVPERIFNTVLDTERLNEDIIKSYVPNKELKEPATLAAQDTGHRTAVFINHKNKTIEYFEPHGGNAAWEPEASQGIELAIIDDERYKEYKYIPPADHCPVRGPQIVTSDEFCASWTMLYIVLRVKFLQLTSKQIQQELVKLSRLGLQRVLAGFMCYVDDYMTKYGLKNLLDWSTAYRLKWWKAGFVPSAQDKLHQREAVELYNKIQDGLYDEALILLEKFVKYTD